jgi:uncharacterized protein YndB with AHSA1/START domain
MTISDIVRRLHASDAITDGQVILACVDVPVAPERAAGAILHREWSYPNPAFETVVTCQLTPIATGTRIAVRHEGFGGRVDPARHYAEAWQRVLDQLRDSLAEF